MKDSKTKNEAVSNHLCTSVEVVSVCRLVLREPMHLCTCVSEEGGDGEVPCSEMSSLLSYTLRYFSFTEVDSVCRVSLREPIHLTDGGLSIESIPGTVHW